VKPEALFDAPWGWSLKLMTLFSAGILIGVPVFGLLNRPDNALVWLVMMVILPLAILISAAFFTVRGYAITNNTLFVQRLVWKTEFNLNDLQTVEIDPNAMKRSIRTLGNGGLFCFAGHFRNKRLGVYRALATDPKLAVILRFRDKVVVVTPDHPTKFATQIKDRLARPSIQG